ncbi:MAG: hypothetical protein ABIH83_01505 [Candidatus Micrarchaeota archaeon]
MVDTGIYDSADLGASRLLSLHYALEGKKSGYIKTELKTGFVKIASEGVDVTIHRPLTKASDIIRCTIDNSGPAPHIIYSRKTEESIWAKYKRDIGIDFEYIPKDEIDYSMPSAQGLSDIDSEFKSHIFLDEIPSYRFEYSIPDFDAINTLYHSDVATSKTCSMLRSLAQILSEQVRTENTFFDLIANLEWLAMGGKISSFYDSDKAELGNHIDYQTLYETIKPQLPIIEGCFREFHKIFLDARSYRSLDTTGWMDMEIVPWPINVAEFDLRLIENLYSDREPSAKIQNFVKNYFIILLGQEGSVSSVRRHFINAAFKSLEDFGYSPSDGGKWLENLRNLSDEYELKCSSLQSYLNDYESGWSLLKLNQFLFLQQELLLQIKTGLHYLRRPDLPLENGKSLAECSADARRMLISYTQYVAWTDVITEKNLLDDFENILSEYDLKYNTDYCYGFRKKTDAYISAASKRQGKIDEFVCRLALDKEEDPYKQKRKIVWEKLMSSVQKLAAVAPIHARLVKFLYSQTESHVNYKFGQWFEYNGVGQIFTPELLGLMAITMLNESLPQKQKIEKKQKEIQEFIRSSKGKNPHSSSENDAFRAQLKRMNRELDELKSVFESTTFPVPPAKGILSAITSFLSKKSLGAGTKEMPEMFFREIPTDELMCLLDDVHLGVKDLNRLNLAVLERLESLYSTDAPKGKKKLTSLLFPPDFIPFKHMETDILDQMENPMHAEIGFTHSKEYVSFSIVEHPAFVHNSEKPSGKVSVEFKGKNLELLCSFDSKDYTPPQEVDYSCQTLADGAYGPQIPKERLRELIGGFGSNYDFARLFDKIIERLHVRSHLESEIKGAGKSKEREEEDLKLLLAMLYTCVTPSRGNIVDVNGKWYENAPKGFKPMFDDMAKKGPLPKEELAKYCKQINESREFYTLFRHYCRISQAKHPLTNTIIRQKSKMLA